MVPVKLVRVKPVFSNARIPIVLTELGMVIEAKPMQLENAFCPMFVMELGMVIEAKPKQLENPFCPMLVTE